jgi:chromosome segregation ATPase
MAVIELGNTKVANRLISYAEKRSVVTAGVNCLPMAAKYQFSATRCIFGKNDNIQAHHVIQSFSPGEVTADQANAIGVKLAEKLASGYECVVYTHIDKAHIHNHIVINSVEFENGKKFHLHGQDGIDKTRAISDELCRTHGFSVIEGPTAKERYTMAEQGLRNREKKPWKDMIREAVQHELLNSTDYENFKQNMQNNHKITINERGETVTYRMEGMGRAVRGRKLGMDYEFNTISNIRTAIEKEKEKFKIMQDEAMKDLDQINQKLYDQDENYKQNKPILENLEDQITEKAAKIKDLSNLRFRLSNKTQEYEKGLHSIKSSIHKNSIALKSLSDEKTLISSNLEALRHKESMLSNRIDAINNEGLNLTSKNVALLEKQTSLQTDISSAEQILNKKYSEMNEINSYLSTLRHDEAATAKNLQALQTEFKEFDTEFNDFFEKAQVPLSKYKNNIDLIDEINQESAERKNDLFKLVIKSDPELREIEKLARSINYLSESYEKLADDRNLLEKNIVEAKVSWDEKVDHLKKIRDYDMNKNLRKNISNIDFFDSKIDKINSEKSKEIEKSKSVVAKRYESKLDPIAKMDLPELDQSQQEAIEKKNKLAKLAKKHVKPIYTVKDTAKRLKNACEKHFGDNFMDYQPIDVNTGTVSFSDENQQLWQCEVFLLNDQIKIRAKKEVVPETPAPMDPVNQLNVIIPDIKDLLGKEKLDLQVLIEKTRDYYGKDQFMSYDPIENDKAIIIRSEENKVLKHTVWIENNNIIAGEPEDITIQWERQMAEAAEEENDWDMEQ